MKTLLRVTATFLALTIFSVSARPQGTDDSPRLDLDDLRQLAAYIPPGVEDLAWESVPWLPSFAEGLDAARSAAKPVLLWVMNGHPLGCT
jgi:hypothetical protein